MSKFRRSIQGIGNRGVTSIEYAIIIGLIALVMAIPMTLAAGRLFGGFNTVDQQPLGSGSVYATIMSTASGNVLTISQPFTYSNSMGSISGLVPIGTKGAFNMGIPMPPSWTTMPVTMTNVMSLVDSKGSTMTFDVSSIRSGYVGGGYASVYLSGTLNDAASGVSGTPFVMAVNAQPNSVSTTYFDVH